MVRSVSKRTLTIGAMLILLGAALSIGSGGPQPAVEAQGMHHPGTAMPGMATPRDFDLMFIDMMVLHHEGAIAMARMASNEAEHQEIRSLAETIMTGQQTEIEQMTAWRDTWYPNAPHLPLDQMAPAMTQLMTGNMHGMPVMAATPGTGMMGNPGRMGMAGMMNPAAETEALQNASGPFDLAFLDLMIPHHQSAVAMAQTALQYAQHQEIRTLAQQIIDAQQAEIAQMQSWRETWYGGTPTTGAIEARPVEVTLSEFKVESSVTTFELGIPYRFTVTNKGSIPHEFMIMPRMDGMGQMDMATLDDMAVVMIPASELPPGASQSVEVTFTKIIENGQLELVCAVPGHYDAGMRLAAEVVPPAA